MRALEPDDTDVIRLIEIFRYYRLEFEIVRIGENPMGLVVGDPFVVAIANTLYVACSAKTGESDGRVARYRLTISRVKDGDWQVLFIGRVWIKNL